MAAITKDKVLALNEQIAHDRAHLYTMYSDPYFLAYQKYMALGNISKAEENRALWLEKVREIDEQNPYYDVPADEPIVEEAPSDAEENNAE